MLDGELDASSSGPFLVGLTTSGAIDTSFGASGRVALPFSYYDGFMAIAPDDKIHLVGKTPTASPLVYLRLLSNGLPDNSVGGSGTSLGAHALALPSNNVERIAAPRLVSNSTLGDGLMFAFQDNTRCPAGSANDYVGPRPMFLKFATSGATTIAPGGANSSGGSWWCGFPQPAPATDLTPSGSDVSPDGKLYLQMSAQTSFDDPVGASTYVYRFNEDMTVDVSWGTGGRLALPAFPGQSAAAGLTFKAIGVGLKVYPDGRIVSAVREGKSDATGQLPSRSALIGLLPTGAIDTAFGSGGATRFDAFAMGLDAQDDGRIVLASTRYLWRFLGYPAASPTTLSFSTIAPGATNVQGMKISNSASPTFAITGTVVPSPYSIVGSSCPTQLVSGASCTLSVMFAPTAAGNYFSTLTISTTGRTLSVPLRGVSEAVKACTLDISGDGNTRAESDGVLLTRYLLGFRGEALVNGVALGAARPNAASVELFMDNASPFDIVGRSVGGPTALIDGLILTRLMQGVPDAALLNGITIPATARYRSAVDIRANVNASCGTAY